MHWGLSSGCSFWWTMLLFKRHDFGESFLFYRFIDLSKHNNTSRGLETGEKWGKMTE
jgi:hypothetical protein